MSERTADFELSCGLPPGPAFADLAVLAEELGYTRVWVFDSAPLWEDPFVHLALAAERTARIGFGTAVLIPEQRSPMTMASEDERHLLTFEGHVTHLPDRDRALLEHIDTRMLVGDEARIGNALARIAAAGFKEVIYTPTGPDVARELRAFASSTRPRGDVR